MSEQRANVRPAVNAARTPDASLVVAKRATNARRDVLRPVAEFMPALIQRGFAAVKKGKKN